MILPLLALSVISIPTDLCLAHISMADLADKVLEPAVSKGLDKLYEILNYIWDYQTYIQTLRTDFENLKASLADIQREVEDARSNRRDIKQQVDKWLDEGNSEINTAEAFLDSIQSPACCWKFTCECNCKRRYSVAKTADSHSKQMKTLMGRSSFAGGVSFEPKPPPLAPTLASGYKTIPSRERCLEMLKEALSDRDKLVIGLHGAKGVGKTMLIKKLAVKIESGGEFNGIVLTSGWREETEAGLAYMQDEIAERIGFSLEVKTLSERARRLNDKFTSMGKVVIILDNVEKRLDLTKIGIPWPDTSNGSRIVVVSRSLDVCEEMRTQVNLELKALSQEEALALFDEFENEYGFNNSMNIRQVRDHIFLKPEWMPGEIEKCIRSFHHKPLLPSESIVTTNANGKKTLMLGAEALEIEHIEKPQHWRWLTPGLSTSRLKVAELIIVWGLHIGGTVREEWLSPATNYKAYFVYQLTPRARGFKITPVEVAVGSSSRTCYLDPSTATSMASEGARVVPNRRKDGWLEIEVGSFFNVGYLGAVIDLFVKEDRATKTGLLVQGFEMRPMD